MTLHEKIQLLESLLVSLKEESALALTLQGLYTEPDKIKVKDIPDRILQIRVYDFNYKFDFKALDSVGTIHSRFEGTATGGMPINPVFPEFKVLDKIDMRTVTPIFKSLSGVYGQNSSIVVNCVFPTIETQKQDFNTVSIMPENWEERFVVLPEPLLKPVEETSE